MKPTSFCHGVVEASWILVLIATPLLFNIHSNNSFELDKAAALRNLALILLLAWAVAALERRRASPDRRVTANKRGLFEKRALLRWVKGEPLLVAAFLFLAVQLVSTAASVAPHISLWGSYIRFQGMAASAAYLAFFFSLLALSKRWLQIERILQAILTTSIPVSLYGIIQHFGIDPVVWVGDASTRIGSTLGNPIFLGAYLTMVVPVTIYRHLEAGKRIAENQPAGLKAVLIAGGGINILIQVAAWSLGPLPGTLAVLVTFGVWTGQGWILGKSIGPFLRIATYGALLSMQLACILVSQSRGPILALVVSAAFLILLWAAAHAKWKWAAASVGIVAAVAGLLAVLNLPSLQPAWARETLHVNRMTQMLEASGRVRLHIWGAAVQLLASSSQEGRRAARAGPFEAAGSSDSELKGGIPAAPGDRYRAIVGYGPETMRLVIAPHVPPALGLVERRGALPDRAHNETLDVLLASGLLGLAAYLVLIIGILRKGLQTAGVADLPRHRRMIPGACLAGGLVSVASICYFDQSWRLFGIALPFGILAGSFAYLAGFTIWNASKRGISKGPWSKRQLLSAVLLSAVVAHFVEIQFGIAITATRTYFWIYIALLIVLARPASQEDESRSEPAVSSGADGGAMFSSHLAGSLILTAVLIATVFNFYSASQPFSAAIVWIAAFTWVIGALLVRISQTSPSRGVGEGRECKARLYPAQQQEGFEKSGLGMEDFLRGPLASPSKLWAGLAVYAGIPALGLATVLLTRLSWLAWFADRTTLPLLFFPFLLLCAGSLAYALWSGLGAKRGYSLPAAAGGIVLATVTAGVIVATCLNVVRADIFYKQARLHASAPGLADRAVELTRHALRLQRSQDVYWGFLGQILKEKGEETKPPDLRDKLFEQARESLLEAIRLSPLDSHHIAGLADLYQSWARRTQDQTRKKDRLDQASFFYRKASEMFPGNVLWWNERAANYQLAGELRLALEAYQHSLKLDDSFGQTYRGLGDLYLAQGRWEDAAESYRHAISRNPDMVDGLRGLAAATFHLGLVTESIEAHERLLELAPGDLAALQRLAQLHASVGSFNSALAYADRALELAPPYARSAVQRMIDEMRAQKDASRQ